MIKGIIFDMDGTITLTEGLHHRALAAVFKEYGIEYDFHQHVTEFAGSGSTNIFKKFFERNGRADITDDEIKKCIEKKRVLYTKIIQEEEIAVVTGAKEFIKKIAKRGLKIIIATGNGDLDAVGFILKKIGIEEFFPQIVSVKEVEHGKPFPDVFLEAAKRIGLAPDECVVIEDSINGVEAAKAAGMRAIALLTTTDKNSLIASGAYAVVKDYNEIIDNLIF